jgi:hypothetical protein
VLSPATRARERSFPVVRDNIQFSDERLNDALTYTMATSLIDVFTNCTASSSFMQPASNVKCPVNHQSRDSAMQRRRRRGDERLRRRRPCCRTVAGSPFALAIRRNKPFALSANNDAHQRTRSGRHLLCHPVHSSTTAPNIQLRKKAASVGAPTTGSRAFVVRPNHSISGLVARRARMRAEARAVDVQSRRQQN